MAAAVITAAKTILVVDDMPVIRGPIAASLQGAGHAVVTASSGEKALRTMRDGRFDLVLMDVMMPGMDGLAVLRQMRADPQLAKVPVILLTAAEGRGEVLEAVKYGVRDYLLKSQFSLKELHARVNKHFHRAAGEAGASSAAGAVAATSRSATDGAARAEPRQRGAATAATARLSSPKSAGGVAGSSPTLLTREQCIERAEGAMQGKTLSGVVAQVIGVAVSPHSDLSQLATLVGRDPVVAARVLRAANIASAATARGVISNVTDAIRQIGSAAVRNIAATVGVFDVMPAGGPESFNPVRCWQHCFAVAKLCEWLAGRAGEGGSAYPVGLCHDLGDILLQTQFGSEYRKVMEA